MSKQGLTLSLSAFQEWLASLSSPTDPRTAALLEAEAVLSQAQADEEAEMRTALKLIASFAFSLEDQEAYQHIVESYCGIRATYLRGSLEAVVSEARASIAERKGGSYQRGSHPYLQALRSVAKLIGDEDMFAHSVLPGSAVEAVLGKTVAGIADEWFLITRSLTEAVAKAIERREYSDHVFLFDLIEAFNEIYSAKSASLACLRKALQMLTLAGSSMLLRLAKDMEAEGMKQGSALPTPPNGTVYEQTSNLIGCLKRMLDYETVIEAIIGHQSEASWDGSLVRLGPEGLEEAPLMSQFYQDSLKALGAAIETRSGSFKKKACGQLFKLNNYRYILRAITTSSLGTLLPAESEARYQSHLDATKELYLRAWKSIATILQDDLFPEVIAVCPPSMGPKDRLKMFMSEMEEAVKYQAVMAVPDAEARGQLREQIQEILLPPFQRFYQEYTDGLHWFC